MLSALVFDLYFMRKIFEYLWKIILSDGIVDDFESSMMTKLTGLFHLSGKESADAKNNAKESLNQ